MSWIITTTLTLSFAWVWSRWLTGRDAWKNDRIDYSVGIIAVSSWLVNTMDIVLNPNIAGELTAEYNMFGEVGMLLITIAYCTIWIGITYVFIRFRVKVGNSQDYNS